MTIEEKKILISEIKNYTGNISLIEIYKLLKDERLRKKVLIQNKTGIIGNLLDKYKDSIDDEIIKEICVRDYVNEAYYDIEELIDEIEKLFIVKDIEWIKKEFYKDKDILRYEVIENNVPISYYKDYLDNVKNDKEFMLVIIKECKSGSVLEYASEELWKDKEIMLEAIKYEFSLIEYANEELKNDKKFVLKAIKYGNVLEWASKELRKDKEIMLEAIRNNSSYFEYASKALKNDKEVVMEAVKNNSKVFKYASEELQNDIDFIISLATKNIVVGVSNKMYDKIYSICGDKYRNVIIIDILYDLSSVKTMEITEEDLAF